MAKPRIFISSTYFDLRSVRADLERFINEIGYEPILFERGHIPYGKDDPLEEYCYKEINSCDILIAIIGGNYGSESKDQFNSITQRELKTAVDLSKQIYVFVESSVYNEFKTYKANKDVDGFKPVSVDDIKIFTILEEIYALPSGNPITPFEISENIVRFLREQWAGLFQRLLQESARQKEINTLQNLQDTASTLKQLVTYLTEEKTKGDKSIKAILMANHPAFSSIKKLADIQYRVAFHNMKELDSLLSARGYVKDERPNDRGTIEWDNDKKEHGIKIAEHVFEKSGKLKIFEPNEWDDNWIQGYHYSPENYLEDDIPF